MNARAILSSLSLLISMSLATRGQAQDEPAEDAPKDGKVQYALILPEEKTPELVKPNEANPFGGLIDEKTKDTASGEETKVSDLLRGLPVVGKSSRNIVLLGDIILRRGQLVPPVIPNQTVQLKVNDITPDHIELVWVEKKPTGLNPRLLMIATDVSPQVKQRLPGSMGAGSGGPNGGPVMTVVGRNKPPAPDPSKPAQRAELVQDEARPQGPASPAAPASQAASAGSALLNLFFGNQVKEPAKPGAPKPENTEEDKPHDDARR